MEPGRNKRMALVKFGLKDLIHILAYWILLLVLSSDAFCINSDQPFQKISKRGDSSKLHIHADNNSGLNTEYEDLNIEISDSSEKNLSSRRKALQQIASTSALVTMLPLAANAGVAQIDSKSGQLFSPKKQMLGGGGSDLARGIKLQSRNRDGSLAYSNGEPIQTVYGTRFITYLSRFLLNYDPAAASWWAEQKFGNDGKMTVESRQKLRFAEFAESVEVGLADYFVGPYGSYASVQAGKLYMQLLFFTLYIHEIIM